MSAYIDRSSIYPVVLDVFSDKLLLVRSPFQENNGSRI